MKFLIATVFILLTILSHVHCKGHCVTRGQCGEDEVTLLKQPCVYNGPPISLKNASAVEVLKTLCPNLETGPDFSVCCDADQIASFQTNVEPMAILFKRCPSCCHNLLNMLCQLTCSAEQSLFLKVMKSTKFEDKESASELNYFIAEKFAQGLFDSCKDVQLASTPFKAIDVCCGSYSNDCTPHRFLDYLGGHDPSPYQINFQYELNDTVIVNGTTYTPMNKTIVPCSQAVSPGGVACSCVDCPCHS